ncbi:MAG: hypothetical protein ACLGGX_06070 [Bdellovibrionia bacterium]
MKTTQYLSIKVLSFALSVMSPLLVLDTAQACKMTREPKQNFFINPKLGISGVFSDGAKMTADPSVVERCQSNAGKFLMISTGVRVPSLNADTADISFDGTFEQPTCSIVNSPVIEPMDFSTKKANFDSRYKFLRMCTHTQVYDLDNRPIAFSADQKACKITSIGSGVLKLEGEYCFLRISPLNRFAAQVIINDECKKASHLRKLGIESQDIEGVINTYVVGDETGVSTDVDPLGSNRFRIYIQPNDNLMALTEAYDEETPRFPSTYTPELHLGDLRVRGSGQTWFFDTTLLASNSSTSKCKAGECVRTSNFNVPVVGEVELARLNKGKFEFVDEWWFASMLDANYEGILKNPEKNLIETEFKTGDRYRLVMTFVDPYEDFNLFVSAFKQFLIDLRPVNGTAGIDVIQSLSPLAELIGLNPLDNLPNMRSPNMEEELARVLDSIAKLGAGRQWPAYFEDICDSSMSTCIKAGKSKFYLKLTAEFTVGNVNPETGYLEFKDYSVKRESPLGGSYTRKVIGMPKVVCD